MCDKGKIPNEYPFSFHVHLVLDKKEAGVSLRIQCSLNGSSFSVHKHRTPKHTQQANSDRLDTLLFTLKRPIQMKQQEAERQRGWARA